MSVLTKYNIYFHQTEDGSKDVSSINDWLSCCLYDHHEEIRAKQLFDLVNEVLSGMSIEIELPTQSLYLIIIQPTQTFIYKDIDEWEGNPSIEADFTLPTVDFKIIVEAWRDYVTQ